MSEDEVYLKLIEHLKEFVFNIPDHEELLPIFKILLTPEEAEILMPMSFAPLTVRQISRKLKMPIEKLQPKLDALAKRGCVFYTRNNGY